MDASPWLYSWLPQDIFLVSVFSVGPGEGEHKGIRGGLNLETKSHVRRISTWGCRDGALGKGARLASVRMCVLAQDSTGKCCT